MTFLLATLLLLSISGFIAWRYARAEIGPDLAYFNLAAFTGSWYGRDFADCKTPAIHLWYYGLSKLVGANLYRIRFTHHFLIGAGSVAIMYLTNSFWNGLAFAVLVNSGWLMAFHGNVGQLPALCIALALCVKDPWIALAFMGMAAFIEPKLIISAGLMVALLGWWIPALVYGALGILVYVAIRRTQIWAWMWESSWTIPRAMGKMRASVGYYFWAPWFMSIGLLYIMPWAIVAGLSSPDWRYWVPAIAFALMVGYSKAVRPNHWIPLAGWITVSGIAPMWVLILSVVDWTSSGLYLGDIWGRFYQGIRDDNIEAREIGELIRDKPGSLWVNGYHSAVYIHARKPVPYGMTEQYEINDVVPKRREEMKRRFQEHPPKWVVECGKPRLTFNGNGYRVRHDSSVMRLWEMI